MGDNLPDFSRVGYREGHVAIPQIPVRATVLPSSNEADDTARIQEAIDKVSRMVPTPIGDDGAVVRGAVLLKAGVYRVAGALVLHTSGVVLRGEGQSEGGTTVKATGKIQRDFILVNGMLTSDMGSVQFQNDHQRHDGILAEVMMPDGIPAEVMMPRNGYKTPNGPTTQTREDVSVHVGETRIPVQSTANFNPGDHIVIKRPATYAFIASIGMNKLPDNGKPLDNGRTYLWKPEDYTFYFERTILGIDSNSNSIEIDIPMVMTLDTPPIGAPAAIFKFQHKVDLISDVGIEDMLLISDYDTNVKEGELEVDEDHAFYAVVLDNVRNGWVANVTTKHFVSGIFASTWSRYITIQDCSVKEPISKPDEGRRRYAFNLSGQMGLVKRCFTENARHDFLTLGRVCGPNAFVESEGKDANNDTGPHERWAMGTLYDNIICNTINVRNRLSMGTGQGWAGVYQVVYNCTAKKKSIIRDAPNTNNWLIGFKGPLDASPDDPDDKEINIKTASLASDSTYPRSLYWSQLIKRMGGDSALVEHTVGPFMRG